MVSLVCVRVHIHDIGINSVFVHRKSWELYHSNPRRFVRVCVCISLPDFVEFVGYSSSFGNPADLCSLSSISVIVVVRKCCKAGFAQSQETYRTYVEIGIPLIQIFQKQCSDCFGRSSLASVL